MQRSPYFGHRFPPTLIQHAVWLYLRFTLTLRDVEEMLAERGLDLTYEIVRRWVNKFGPLFARELRAAVCERTTEAATSPERPLLGWTAP